jgi:hypothetical protein
VHEVEGPPPWLSPERLAEQRRRLLPSSYERLFENRWTAAEDRLIDPAALRECVVLDGPQPPRPDLRYVIGLDIGTVNDATVAAVCHGELTDEGSEDGRPRTRVVLDRMAVWKGTRAKPVQFATIEAWLVQTATAYNRAEIRADPWQALDLCQRIRARGFRIEEFSFGSVSVGRLATTLFRLLRDRALALPDDPELFDELTRVRLRETAPSVVRVDHAAGEHDDRVIALALAASAIVEHGRIGPMMRPRPLTSYDRNDGAADLAAAFPTTLRAADGSYVDLGQITYDSGF